MPQPIRVLIVEDNPDDAELMALRLLEEGYLPEWRRVENEAEYLAGIAPAPDLILADWSLPQFSGMNALLLLQERHLDIPFIIVSGSIGEEAAVRAVRTGAYDYVLKHQMGRLGQAVARALEDKRSRDERGRHEEEIARVAREWQTTFDASNDAIWVLDHDHRVLRSNKAAERFFHRPCHELIGRHCWEIVHGGSRPIPECPTVRARNSLRREIMQLQIGAGWFEVTVDPILDAAGRFAGAVHIVSDITERKRTEETLRRAEENFRHSLDESPFGVRIVTPQGGTLYANRAILDMYGYQSVDELRATPLKQRYTPATYEDYKARLKKKSQGERHPSEYEIGIVTKSGNIRHLQVFEKEVFWNGERQFQMVYQDITERKRAEQEMASLQDQFRQAQKMEAIGQLAGGIAHDFNNLLTVIQGYAQISALDLQERDPLRANIEEIRKAADRAADLTRQLLAFSRKQILEMRVLDLNQALDQMDKMLRRVIGEDIELVSILSESPAKVKADPGQVEQVILNLAVNARDAMPEGGKLTIETNHVELDEAYAAGHVGTPPGRYIMLALSDTGTGMPPEVRDRIFEPFFTTKEKERGTGLGLSTVYGIVTQSGGIIWVYSEPGQGTTFKIYLPQVDEPVDEVKKEAALVLRGHETVLVVEDEEAVRKLAVRVLKRQGYKVLEAPDGGKAFMLCEEFREPIHLLLTDVVMPGMSGRVLAERLRALHPEMKVLYMSGYTDNVILHHGLLDPGVDFVQKPFTVDNLARKVREVLARE